MSEVTFTAKEFVAGVLNNTTIVLNSAAIASVADICIMFAQIHVSAALEAAADNAQKMSSTRDTILKSYPLENIK